MNYIQIDNCNLANGDGARVVLWVAGCVHHCLGCHNANTWDHDAGQLFDHNTLQHLLDLVSNKFIDGVTFSGGDPLAPRNYSTILMVAKTLKQKYPDKTIWVWTGYTLEQLKTMKETDILNYIDYLIDGLYKQNLPTKKPFRGSDNQKRYQIINGAPKFID